MGLVYVSEAGMVSGRAVVGYCRPASRGVCVAAY